MKEDVTDWTLDFARPQIRDSLSQLIDDTTPGLIDRLGTDAKAYKDLVAVTHIVATEAEEILRETVIAARHAGLNWEEIGEQIGLSRQEAMLRFTPKSGTEPVGNVGAAATTESGQPIGTRITIGTPSNELKTLQRAGEYGWHAVGFDYSSWTLEYDNRQWEHASTLRKEPPGSGWERVGRWGPTVWWKRPTEKPVLPGNPLNWYTLINPRAATVLSNNSAIGAIIAAATIT